MSMTGKLSSNTPKSNVGMRGGGIARPHTPETHKNRKGMKKLK